ncbi:hypothetical protein LCGC14_2159160, partial [marine sediment metagenome]
HRALDGRVAAVAAGKQLAEYLGRTADQGLQRAALHPALAHHQRRLAVKSGHDLRHRGAAAGDVEFESRAALKHVGIAHFLEQLAEIYLVQRDLRDQPGRLLPAVEPNGSVERAIRDDRLQGLDHETAAIERQPDTGVVQPRAGGDDGLCIEGPGILFFDEIEKATTAVKNAALQIVLDRRVGDYLLPDDVAIVGAGNQEDDNCFSAPLGAALANRMLHAEVEHDIDVWIRWAYENKIEEDIIGYLQFEPINLYDNNGNNAFPSPRSWAMASKMIAGIENDSLIRTFITSAVGEGVANQFTAWSKVYKQVDTEAIVTRGIIPEMKVSDPGFNYAVAMAVAIYARKRGTKKYHNNIVKFLEMIGPDLQVVFFRQLEQETMVQFSKDPNFADIIKNIMDTFDI